jgi:alkaline phosphatase
MKRFFIILYAVLCTLYSFAEVKYVFYFIGDGMGSNQILGAEMYRSALQGEPLGRVQTLMTTFPYAGLASTHSASNGITDSPAAGTTLATGVKTNRNTLGLDKDGKHLTTITEDLHREGWGIGIMTTVAIDHATPAAFYSHVNDRDAYYTIGQQLCESGFDFFGGAGFHDPEGKNDNKPNLYRMAEKAGYTIAHGAEEAIEITRSRDHEINKLIMIQSTDDQGAKHGSNLPYVIDRKEGDLTLAQIVRTAIPFVDERYDKWFMMIEGGMIDYAGHGNDAATAFGEVWDMDEAMRVAYDFYLAHPDETLIVVTADHETGGLALGNGDYTLHLDRLQYQQCSAWILSDLFTQLFQSKKKPSWEEVKSLYREQLGFWDKVEISAKNEAKLKALYKDACKGKTNDTKTMYKTINKLGDAGIEMLNKKAHVGWTSHSHTAHAVPVFAIGVKAELFTGWHDNTEIVPLIRQALR